MHDTPTTDDSIATVSGGTFPSLVLEAAGPIVVVFMSYAAAAAHSNLS